MTDFFLGCTTSWQECGDPAERSISANTDYMNNECSPHSPPWERYHITAKSIGAADALQVPLIRLAAFENHLCGHEQECAGIYRGTFSTHNPFKFSQEVRFCGRHGRIVELKVEDIKITGECYRRSGALEQSRDFPGRLKSTVVIHRRSQNPPIGDGLLKSKQG
jgi:hypothetical protein